MSDPRVTAAAAAADAAGVNKPAMKNGEYQPMYRVTGRLIYCFRR